MKYFLLFVISVNVGFTAAWSQATKNLSLASPPSILSMLGEDFISSPINERDFALSPDGKEIFFTISTPKSTFQTIVHSKQISEGKWSPLEVVTFAGMYSDLEPAFSPDGNTLYFSSNRPLAGNEVKDFDIWKVSRKDSGWGVPENLGAPINTEADEFYPSITKSSNLYFTATYKGGPGREDIYVANFQNGTYQKPVALDTTVNSKFYEFNAFVSADEKYILFTSYGRADDTGGGDLYMSVKDSNGKWQPAKNLKRLNSKQLDYCPSLSPDGKRLFITSDRHQLPTAFIKQSATYRDIQELSSKPMNANGNIYWIDFQVVLDQFNTDK
jgi:Tol biopolymer transport system component